MTRAEGGRQNGAHVRFLVTFAQHGCIVAGVALSCGVTNSLALLKIAMAVTKSSQVTVMQLVGTPDLPVFTPPPRHMCFCAAFHHKERKTSPHGQLEMLTGLISAGVFQVLDAVHVERKGGNKPEAVKRCDFL